MVQYTLAEKQAVKERAEKQAEELLQDLLQEPVDPTLGEGEFEGMSWRSFVLRCNAAEVGDGVRCYLCNQRFSCKADNPYALWTHIRDSKNAKNHPSRATINRWQIEWDSPVGAGGSSSASFEPIGSAPLGTRQELLSEFVTDAYLTPL